MSGYSDERRVSLAFSFLLQSHYSTPALQKRKERARERDVHHTFNLTVAGSKSTGQYTDNAKSDTNYSGDMIRDVRFAPRRVLT